MREIGQRIVKMANEFFLHLDRDSSSVSPANAKRGLPRILIQAFGVVVLFSN
jgi:hypothetical protein